MSKPLMPDMSPLICPINDLYKTEGKENIAPISPQKSDKWELKGSTFIAPYKDRENSASNMEKEVAKSKGKDLRNMEYSVAKDSLYFREIMRKKHMLMQKELLTKVTWQPLPSKAPTKKEASDVHLAAKAATKVAAKAKVAAQGKGKIKKSKSYRLGIVAL